MFLFARRRALVAGLLLGLLPFAAHAQGTIFPGQTGATLLQSLYSSYSPSASGSGAHTLGYDNARDVLYGTVYPQIQGGPRTS